MSSRSRPLGRPLSLVSIETLRLASHREVTYLDVARELQLSRTHASQTLYELKAGGHLQDVGRRLVDGARKPVPVVRAVPADGPPSVFAGILGLDWPARA